MVNHAPRRRSSCARTSTNCERRPTWPVVPSVIAIVDQVIVGGSTRSAVGLLKTQQINSPFSIRLRASLFRSHTRARCSGAGGRRANTPPTAVTTSTFTFTDGSNTPILIGGIVVIAPRHCEWLGWRPGSLAFCFLGPFVCCGFFNESDQRKTLNMPTALSDLAKPHVTTLVP